MKVSYTNEVLFIYALSYTYMKTHKKLMLSYYYKGCAILKYISFFFVQLLYNRCSTKVSRNDELQS